jgi:hypothetical protein
MFRVFIAALLTLACLPAAASSEELLENNAGKVQLVAFFQINPMSTPMMSPWPVTKVSYQCGGQTCAYGCCAQKIGNECVHTCPGQYSGCGPGQPC